MTHKEKREIIIEQIKKCNNEKYYNQIMYADSTDIDSLPSFIKNKIIIQ